MLSIHGDLSGFERRRESSGPAQFLCRCGVHWARFELFRDSQVLSLDPGSETLPPGGFTELNNKAFTDRTSLASPVHKAASAHTYPASPPRVVDLYD